MKTWWIKASFFKKIREGQVINKHVSGPFDQQWYAELIKMGRYYDKSNIDIVEV